MQYPPSSDAGPGILIPWDGLTPLNQVVTFAHMLGGQDVNLTLLSLMPAHTADNALSADSTACRLEQATVLSSIDVLDLPDVGSDPASGIAMVAAERNVDLILMATPCHPAGALDPSCLAAQFALDSPIPVMIVHFECDNIAAFPPPIRRLLVPLDGSTRATQALPFAADLARRLRLPVQLVMVIDPVQVLPPAYAHDADAAAEMVASLKHDAHWVLTQAEQLLAHQGVTVNSDLVYGPVVSSLKAAVQPGDVLVMTTHGIGSAPRSRLGSVAARLVADVPGPLVIMRGIPPAEIVVRARGEAVPYGYPVQPIA